MMPLHRATVPHVLSYPTTAIALYNDRYSKRLLMRNGEHLDRIDGSLCDVGTGHSWV